MNYADSNQFKIQNSKFKIVPGQTLMFLGDHTSPDAEGYVRVIREVLARFHPTLHPNLISTGSSEQTARALNTDALLNLLQSSKPDWLIIGIGLADALREPLLSTLVEQYKREIAADAAADTTFGLDQKTNGSVPGDRKVESYRLSRIEQFESNLSEAVVRLSGAGIRPALLTTVLVTHDPSYPLNTILKSYNTSMRDVANRHAIPLVDVERSFADLFSRAGQYKQKISLAGYRGEISPQGEALLARTFLQAFDLLPYAGFRPLR